MYIPFNYENISAEASLYSPNTIKAYNNKTFEYWERSLFQRACSVINFNLPADWSGNIKDFYYYCLFRYGFICVFKDIQLGTVFQPCTLSGYDFYYQPTKALVTNPAIKKTLKLEIGKECELIKLTPDYRGVWDIISYYAEKLSSLDNAINTSIINSKFAYVLGARNRQGAEALKKVLDKINRGEPAVIVDTKLLNDSVDGETPFQFLERTNVKNGYLTTDMLLDFQTILNNFDAEIGIPTIPYQKKERLVTTEAESRQVDSTSRSIVWFETLSDTIKKVNKLYPELDISVALRYSDSYSEEVVENE